MLPSPSSIAAALRALWRSLRIGTLPWLDHTIVLLHAGATGLLVVGFTLLAEAATALFMRLLDAWPPLALAWAALATTAVVAWTRRFAPGAAGSGIPQVMVALDDDADDTRRRRFVSLRLSLHKVGLVSAGLLAGLSIGREGPTVQVGAGVMEHARRWLSPRAGIDSHDLIVAGAAAGIAAAFNTPLGGIVFALEQLSRRRSMTHSSLVIASIVLAGLVAVAVFGNQTYFGRIAVERFDASLLAPGLTVALASGLAGGLFSRLMVQSVRGGAGPVARWRQHRPLAFAAAAGLTVGVIGWATRGATAGAGYAATRALLEGHAELPGVYTLLKFCATWLSAWSGAPAGLFAPSLAIGAGIGHDIALVAGVDAQAAIPLIALGMAGFLAATTQGPITAFIIVMEMVAGQAMVLSLMACALLASGVARLVAPPMFDELSALLRRPGPPPAEAAAPAPPEAPTPRLHGRPPRGWRP